MLDKQLVIVKSEPQRHAFASEVRIDLVTHAGKAHPSVNRYFAGL
jgi:hypothetical protein